METLAWSYIVDASNCVLWIGYHANMEDGTQKLKFTRIEKNGQCLNE